MRRLAGFFHGVRDLLEFGEHRLAVERAAQVVDLAVEQVGAHLRVGRFFEEVVSEEFLVEGGSDLGEEDGVVVVLIRLCVLRVPGVHGVAGLVRERVNVREHVGLVVHQDVGRVAVGAGGECAAAFVFRLVAVAPAAVAEAGFQGGSVLGCRGGRGHRRRG